MVAFQAFLILAAMSVLVRNAESADHVVGWGSGTTNLQSWASAQSFKAGDSITFTYGSSHNVVEVGKAEYDACTTNNPITTAGDGNTVIKLLSPGRRYFICGVPGHCVAGMKVMIDTASASALKTTTPTTSPSIPPSEDDNAATPTLSRGADLSETAPVPQESEANSLVVKVGVGMGAGILMVMLL